MTFFDASNDVDRSFGYEKRGDVVVGYPKESISSLGEGEKTKNEWCSTVSIGHDAFSQQPISQWGLNDCRIQ